MKLTAGQLAQARGCYPENECYRDCVDAAQHAIDGEYADLETPSQRERRLQELADAEAWAAKQTWIQ